MKYIYPKNRDVFIFGGSFGDMPKNGAYIFCYYRLLSVECEGGLLPGRQDFLLVPSLALHGFGSFLLWFVVNNSVSGYISDLFQDIGILKSAGSCVFQEMDWG